MCPLVPQGVPVSAPRRARWCPLNVPPRRARRTAEEVLEGSKIRSTQFQCKKIICWCDLQILEETSLLSSQVYDLVEPRPARRRPSSHYVGPLLFVKLGLILVASRLESEVEHVNLGSHSLIT